MKIRRSVSWLSQMLIAAMFIAGSLLVTSPATSADPAYGYSEPELFRRKQSADVGQTTEQTVVERWLLVGGHVEHRKRLVHLPAGPPHQHLGEHGGGQ